MFSRPIVSVFPFSCGCVRFSLGSPHSSGGVAYEQYQRDDMSDCAHVISSR